ncbi:MULTISPECIES: protein translocase subunit SecD [unclassified Streptomyces]|uniref:protein translocase subunit SecD n=1 Tax=unclassified Streptomyces TaxID=2593676 RepID=UPI002DD863C4|nr:MULTISPECIES: protein translocase subunit SecD [unclassified Streptomyces]WSA75651.1 protein translocase subunit SecD [Streptomyces sp. NBC_01799]WSF87920.1 protein translocase subunit SecD [Streptomyces sp. NBC_01744]WTC83053.1 protein translocase subunit SecD [Streptomyces sp. NBC_01653]WTD32332.1 protein translocase subunit SecD [Streptomyces sp. NBC_01643]WTD87812.1 protein translocase subunit SecD [Streptomyces sp. NBC_01637]
MAAPKKGRGPSGGQGRPGRALALILIAMVALTGGMFLSGHTTPRLGIDLAGGTSITLKAKSQPGKPDAINPTNMDTAVSIIERRVNGLGVSEAEVQTQGRDNIIVNIPKGTNSKQAREQVGTTAQLYFRPVLTVTAGQATPTDTASPSASGSAKPSASPSDKETASGSKATPSAGATTQGRAVTGALTKDTSPSPSATASGTPKASASPSASVDPATAELQKRFAALDCSTKAGRAKAGANAKPTDTTIACSSEGDAKYVLGPAEVSGTDVDSAKATIDQQRGMWIVQMDFTDKGSKKFQQITSKLSQQQSPMNQFAIALDGEVVSAPQVNETLSGSAEISGSFTQQSAQDLANVLSYGALPLSFDEDTVTTVTAALGGEQLQAGLIAGAIGLALVVIYLVAYYRGLALIALLSLLVSGILTYTLMSLLGPAIGFALNLPAVCGAIVAIGITADSFIVYFERIRDEIRDGRTLRPAVERAWPRARRTILVSDFVSFLAAAVLFIVTVGKVQGFAFTLGLTTLLDVVVVFLFTKPVMTLMARTKFFSGGHPWSGLDPKRLGAKPPLRRTRRVNAPTDPKEA